MPRWLLIVVVVLVGFGLAGFAGFRHLTAREAVPETTDYVIDMAEIRRLAAEPGEPHGPPVSIESELVAQADLPRGAVFAGESLREPHTMVHVVFRVMYPDGAFVVIDAGMDEIALAQMGENASFNAEGYQATQRALGEAGTIVVTHEHGDHIRGLATYPEPKDLEWRLVLTREQLDNEQRLDQVDFPAVLRERLRPLEYDSLHALAPGVVLIKAAGHTPGTQMVYVVLGDGREFLFLGDVAWHLDQIRNLHYRPRLITNHMINEDRSAVMAQFRALYDLAKVEPALRMIPSHDREVRAAYLADGAISERFSN